VVGAYGKKDLWLRTKGKKLHERLEACGVANDIKTYDNAGHSFMTDGKHPVAKYTMIPLSSARSRMPPTTRGTGYSPGSTPTSPDLRSRSVRARSRTT